MFNHKKMNLKKCTGCLMAIGMSILSCVGSVGVAHAEEINDGPIIGDLTLLPEEDLTKVPSDGLGSITLQLTDSADHLSKENVKFNVIQVATIENGRYQILERFKSTDVDLNNIKNAEELDTISTTLHKAWKNESTKEDSKTSVSVQDFAENQAFQDEIITTDEDGIAQAKNLPVGVYLLSVNDPSQYEVIKPFVVAIPTWSDNDELFQYDVSVEPKHSALPRLLINKVDASTNQNITGKDFEFTMYDDQDCKNVVQTVQGNTSDGVAEFLVHYGTFYIKETKAPEKYVLSDEMVKVSFTEDGFYINDKKVDLNENNAYSFIYKNTPVEDVNTGLKNHMMEYGIAACGAALVMIALKKRKKNTLGK